MIPTKKTTLYGSLYAFIHFSVETACFYFLFSRLHAHPLWWGLALLFDALAFLPQSVIGLLSDRFRQCSMGFIGSVFIVAALLLPFDIPALGLLGIGNAMIHVSGAQYTLRGTEGSITPVSTFVGGGSFGVITGQLLGSMGHDRLLFVPLLLMLLSGLIMLTLARKANTQHSPVQLDIAANRPLAHVVTLAFLAVAVRGYIGYAIPTEWNKTVPQAILLFFCMGFGKMAGGFSADRIGFRKTTYLSILGGLPFLLFGNSNMVLSLIGVALFSMTMPVTIGILVSVLPTLPGFAFGITTVGLFTGILPAFFIQPDTLPAHQTAVILLSVISLPAILACIKKGA